MRFVCETCRTRYIIPDERARGRNLKIRCKKCSSIIVVKALADEASADQPAEVADRPEREEVTQLIEPPPPAAEPAASELSESHVELKEWHVIAAGVQLGPLPLSRLIEMMVRGEIAARTFVWRDGQGDWKRADEVPEVARWLPAQAPPRIDPPPSPKSPRPSPMSPPPVAVAPRASPSSLIPKEVSDRFFDGAGVEHTPAPFFASSLDGVKDSSDLQHPAAGEITKFFINQARVGLARSVWRTVAWSVASLCALGGLVIGLSRLGVDVPLLPPRQESLNRKIFTGNSGDSRMRDLLYGRPRAPARPIGSATRAPVSAEPPDQGPLAKKTEQHVDQLGQTDKDQLAQLYASQNLGPVKLKTLGSTNAPVIDRTDAPLNPEQVARTVAHFHNGYTGCIDRELKRNPNFQGGKIRIVTTIMSSGLVRQAQIQSDDPKLQRAVAGGGMGTCLIDQTRRMVFPSFQGDPFDAEIPLVVGSAF